MYTVKEVAELLDLTKHTIRYYSDKGLVPNIQRDKNNNRLFNEESINWLTGIKCLKECGMSIESIKDYIDLCLGGDSTVQARYDIILEQRAAAEIQLEKAKKRLKYMEEKVSHYHDIINNIIPDNTNPSKW